MPSICPARSSEARVVRASIRRLGMIGGAAGAIPFFCKYHPGMKGVLRVTK